MNVKEDYGELSSIARQGSGSACRSIYGGFVKWCMGEKDDGSDSIAVQLADESHWNDLVIIIAVVSSKQKETSSTSGMRDSVETSPLFAVQGPDSSARIISLVEKWNHSEGNPQVAYTFDAGPNAVLISQNCKTAAHLLQKLLYYFPPQYKDLSSYLVGDKSILGDAGLHSMEDVEAPPEMKIPGQKFKDDVSYFICSRIGAGPKVVADESQALIDSVTGLPKEV